MPFDDEKRAPEQEGVRIIGAEEAEEALGRDDVAQRISDGEPRFGDRPEAPSVDGPRPAIRFPLPADEAPEPAGTARPAGDLPHWTDPPTGEVPRIFAAEDLEGGDTGWSSFTSGQPRWRGEGPDVDDGYDDFSRLADDETRVGAMAGDDRPDPEDFFAFGDEEPEDDRWSEPAAVPIGGGWDDAEEDEYGNRTRSISSDPRRAAPTSRAAAAYQRPANAGRDVPVAAAVGIGFVAVALICFNLGSTLTIALVTAIIGVAAIELFTVLRQAGYQPAQLLGIAACVALPLAAYYKGEAGIPVVLFLAVVFGLVWYLVGAGGTDRPVLGLSSTLLGVGWVGILGSTAGLMLHPGDRGIGVLIVAVLGTVAYDIGGFVVGRNAGTRPLSAASPNKTVEGLLGGVVAALGVGALAASQIAPLGEGEFLDFLLIGLGIAVAAPLGDLCESLVKRDLDVKDMGTILPGHGGFLDRFDSMLFVLPVVYYLALALA